MGRLGALRREAALHAAFRERIDVRFDGRRVVPVFDPGIEAVPDRKLLAFRFRAAAKKPLRVEI